MDKKKTTNRLNAQELERRKAPFASPIVNNEGEGSSGSPASESTSRSNRVVGCGGEATTTEPLPKPPRIDRINN